MDIEARKKMRYGSTYTVVNWAVSQLKQLQIADPVILLPPDSYVKANGVMTVNIPEPATFYYYTGCRAVCANSPDARDATWALVPVKPTMRLREIRDKEDIDHLIYLYKNYLPAE